jgi:hypothetical protein
VDENRGSEKRAKHQWKSVLRCCKQIRPQASKDPSHLVSRTLAGRQAERHFQMGLGLEWRLMLEGEQEQEDRCGGETGAEDEKVYCRNYQMKNKTKLGKLRV